MTPHELLVRVVEPDNLFADLIASFLWTIVFGRLPKPLTLSVRAFARGREKAPRLRGGLSWLTWLNLRFGRDNRRDNHLARLRE